MTDVMLHPDKPMMLVPNVSNVERFLATVKPSRVVERDNKLMILAAHNSDTVRAARLMGLQVPSPVVSRYNWPGRLSPFDHQRVTTEFLTLTKRGLVLSGMGTGKTASALWAADMLMQEKLVRRVLIVAPLSCLRAVWERELFRILPHRNACILHADRTQRTAMAEGRTDDFFIVNHDGVGIVHEALAARGDIDLIIYDEASCLRNAKTNRFKLLNAWARLSPRMRLWLMTGTPCPNAPTDAWALARLVNPVSDTNPQGAPNSFVRFRDSCMRQQGPYKWVPRPNANVLVRTVLQPAILFRKEDCLDLPPVVFTERMTPLTSEQETAFKEIKRDMQTQARTETGADVKVVAINAAIRLTKLLQVCSGAAYTGDGRTAMFDMTPRLTALEELIEEASKKVVVFVPFRHAIDRVHAYLIDKKITSDVLHGDVTGHARDRLIQRFMDEKDPRVLLAHPKTASHGLNLTVANVIVWFGPTFSAEQYQQANERCDRPGQDSKVTVVNLYSTELERRAFEMLSNRDDMQRGILALYREEIESE